MPENEDASEEDDETPIQRGGKKTRDEPDPSLILSGSNARRHAVPSEKRDSAGSFPFSFLNQCSL